MKTRTSILFVVENDYYPRDARVYNECISLSKDYRCYVLAPRRKKERLVEVIDSVTCVRFPHYEANSLALIPLEYLIAGLWIGVLVPLIVLLGRIRVVHAANPPDFIVPLVWWLKILRVKLIFDVHDLSVETFKGKAASKSWLGGSLCLILGALEACSMLIADAIITTNYSIDEYVSKRRPGASTYVVRNSNPIRFRTLQEVGKHQRGAPLNIGYFGKLTNDEAAGLDNFFLIAETLKRRHKPFKISIVGDGPGLSSLQRAVAQRKMTDHFQFFGFVGLPAAFELIKEFDFGLVTWGYLTKNHLHTAMKVMDYMCCAVPVCSLRLKEQLHSTQKIGIHEDSFEAIAETMIVTYDEVEQYETLRQQTLDRFNDVLCWERQAGILVEAYRSLLGNRQPLTS